MLSVLYELVRGSITFSRKVVAPDVRELGCTALLEE